MSKITIVVNALSLGCSLEAGGGLGKLLTAPTWGEAWVLLGVVVEESFMLLPTNKILVWNLAEPARAWPGGALGLLLQTRLVLLLFFLRAHWAHSGWCGGVWFLETLGVGWVCLPAALLPPPPPPPVPSPSPRWQMNGGFNEHGRGVGQAVLKML